MAQLKPDVAKELNESGKKAAWDKLEEFLTHKEESKLLLELYLPGVLQLSGLPWFSFLNALTERCWMVCLVLLLV